VADRWDVAVEREGFADGLEIRRIGAADQSAALTLLSAALGWSTDPADQLRFTWEHRRNPFGETLGWAAYDGERMVGLRHFLRWEFQARDGSVARTVRAVDTVTHPDYRGRGIFRRLTLGALGELPAEGVRFIFNTPNDQSGPGYLGMGWQVVGRWPRAWRPASARALLGLPGARAAPEEVSLPSRVGLPAAEALSDTAGVERLLAARIRPRGFETRLSVDFLRWRYGAAPLRYRALLAGSRAEDGMVIFRVRPRGRLAEALVCDLRVPPAGKARARELLGRLAEAPDIDLVTRAGGPLLSRSCFVRVPRRSWTVVWRAVDGGGMPRADLWNLTLGDLELF
jgi:hypothetical protein